VEKHEKWKNLWARVISKTQRTCGFHERSSKELCISGQFLSLLSLGREGGGSGDDSYTSEPVLCFSENSGYVQSKTHGNRFYWNRGPCEGEKEKEKGVTKNGMPTPVGVLFSEPPSQQLSEIMLCNYPSHKLEKSDQVFIKRKNCRIQVEYLQQLWAGPHLEVRHS